MSGEVWAKKLPPKTQYQFIVASFFLAGLYLLVHGKWLMAHRWDYYINNNHILSYSSIVESAMLHHDVSYYPTIWHLDLYGKVNGEGVYHHFVTGKNTSTAQLYHVCKKGESMYGRKVNTGCFDLSASTMPYPRILACKCSLKAVINKVIHEMIGQKHKHQIRQQ